MKQALRPVARQGRYRLELHAHDVTLRDVPAGDRFFFAIRDPFERFVSGFNSRRRAGRPYNIPWTQDEASAFARFDTADDLARALFSTDDEERGAAAHAMDAIPHLRHHYWYWFGDEAYLRSRSPDLLMVLRQEHLDDDFAVLASTLGLDGVGLPADPVLAHRAPQSSDRGLGEEARGNLRKWYADDFHFMAISAELRAQSAATRR